MMPPLKPLKKPAVKMTDIGSDWIELQREFARSVRAVKTATQQVQQIGAAAGETEAFKQAVQHIKQTFKQQGDLAQIVNSSLYIRALGSAALESGTTFPLNQALFDHIDRLRPRPSIIFLEIVYQYFLLYYDQLTDFDAVKNWLLSARKKRDELTEYDPHILSKSGATWFTNECMVRKIKFDSFNSHIGLNQYKAGRFLTVAKQIYYVEKLRNIPFNQPHSFLEELQKEAVYTAPYDERGLLGHEILRILINRAPENDVCDAWRNLVMQIAGDPRIPKSHPRYQQWWLHLDDHLRQKVIGWLSKLDLRLFLEALEDYSKRSGDDELIRMYPARKRFLEGLLAKKLVTGTRLYLTSNFRNFLKKNYKDEHLPELYKVSDNNKSIISVQLGQAHLIEGSHSCKLWIYQRLTEQAVIFDYGRKSVSYSELTAGLAAKMYTGKGDRLLIDSIVHNGNWQRNALMALEKTGITINPEDVLTEEDYRIYKRKFGVM